MPDKYLTYVSREFLTLIETMYKIHEHNGDTKNQILEKLDKKFRDIIKKMEK